MQLIFVLFAEKIFAFLQKGYNIFTKIFNEIFVPWPLYFFNGFKLLACLGDSKMELVSFKLKKFYFIIQDLYIKKYRRFSL